MHVRIRKHSCSRHTAARFIPLTLLSQFLSVKNEKSAKEAAQRPPAEPEMKEIDHAAVADKAMELFDSNSDGLVDPVEFFEVVKRANVDGKTVRCMAAASTSCNLSRLTPCAQVDLAMVQDFIESYAVCHAPPLSP